MSNPSAISERPAMTPRRPSTARRLVSWDHLDKAALVAAFLIGAAGSWGFKQFGFGPFVAVAWTIGAMLFYVAAVTLLGRLRIEPEAIGDNCYYLGFLLTLSSLSATLYQLTQSEEQTELMRSIIAGFGVALISTMLGILLRVIFTQLRPDIVARDREMRIELQQAAREFRLELASSIASIKEFSIESIQLASEQGARIAEVTDAAVEAQRARMHADAETYAALLRKTFDEAGAQAAKSIGDNVSAAAHEAQTSIRDALERMSRAVADSAAAQTETLQSREAVDARAAALDRAALERTTLAAGEIEALAARLSGALESVGEGIGRGAAAIEAAGARIRDEEAAAHKARAAAEDAAAKAAGASPGRPAGGLFSGWRS